MGTISKSKIKIKNQNNNSKFINLEQFQSGKYDFKTEIRRKVERWVAKTQKNNCTQ